MHIIVRRGNLYFEGGVHFDVRQTENNVVVRFSKNIRIFFPILVILFLGGLSFLSFCLMPYQIVIVLFCPIWPLFFSMILYILNFKVETNEKQRYLIIRRYFFSRRLPVGGPLLIRTNSGEPVRRIFIYYDHKRICRLIGPESELKVLLSWLERHHAAILANIFHFES